MRLTKSNLQCLNWKACKVIGLLKSVGDKSKTYGVITTYLKPDVFIYYIDDKLSLVHIV